ncbi:MAG: protein kinase [Verrucomicrobiales bacterium]|nr:protein kinase [Verrucomicrobiales bacterium]
MSDPKSSEATILEKALTFDSREAREAYLQGACGGDRQLRMEIDSLLAAHEAAGGFLAGKTSKEAQTILGETPLREGPGTRIGRYKLLQQVGEGGMGVVYMAEQEEPVRRRVALKIIKLGMDSRQVVARFEAERQALAMMDHPNIAKVLDGGATESGRPYFVMELVQGVPITEFCDRARLSAKDRLKLFTQVCQAVQHAHQKGIIHRDLKPSNVLVTLHDGVPVPKVIDFGIAKATNQGLTEKTLFTNFATMIGTPAYMSPEQAEMSGLDVDTRTDIYSLGVLLYELLTGTTPFPERRLRSLGYGEMQRVIVEEEPDRPSTRLSTMDQQERAVVVRNCGEDGSMLADLLSGDLDWIVMKCLEKDRTRRYDSATGLAADVLRHLGNEPVSARPPSPAYRFHKWVRRNRRVFATGVSVALALVFGVVISAWQAVRAGRAERRQSVLRTEAEAARSAEERQRILAEQRVYDSLVGEARALRLAHRVGYRDKVFALIRQAMAMQGVRKNLDELRQEAVACLGDFVGHTPVTYSNMMPGFRFTMVRLQSEGRFAALRLNRHDDRKDALILQSMPRGEELFRMVTDRSIVAMEFVGTNEFAVVLVPEEDTARRRAERHARAEVLTWKFENQRWREVSRRAEPGAFDLLPASPPLVAVDDTGAGTVRFVPLNSARTKLAIPVSATMKSPPTLLLSHGGRIVACQVAARPGDPQGTVELWDLETGLRTRSHAILGDSSLGGVNDDGSRLCLVDDFLNELRVEECGGGRTVNRIPDTMILGVKGPGWMPGRSILGVPSILQFGVRLFDYERNEVIATLDSPSTMAEAIFSRDGRQLFTAGNSHARLYRLDCAPEFLQLGNHAGGAQVVFRPGHDQVATAGFDDQLQLCDASSGARLWEERAPRWEGIGSSPDGRWILLSSLGTREVFVHDAETGRRLLTLGTNAPGGVQSVAMSDDGRFLAMASRSMEDIVGVLRSGVHGMGAIQVWEVHRAVPGDVHPTVTEVRRVSGVFSSLSFLPGSSRVIYFDADLQPQAYLWDVGGDVGPRTLALKPRWDYFNFAPTRDGKAVWMIDAQGNLVCVDLETGQLVSSLTDHSERIDSSGPGNLFLSPDASMLSVPSFTDSSVEIFDTTSRRLRYRLPGRAGSPWGASWSSNSRRIACARSNGEVSVWNLDEVDRVLDELGLGQGAESDPTSRPAKNP